MSGPSSLKAALRAVARSRLVANRQEQDEKSRLVWEGLSALTVFDLARKRCTLMCYVDFQDEVRTTRFFSRFLGIPALGNADQSSASMIVPFCEDGEIVPFRLRSLDELESGYRGILEPKVSLRCESDRRISPEVIELVIVPGLAFDRRGNRLGRGGGFYDRFLPKLSQSATVVGLAFDCQVFESIPTEPCDRPVDILIAF